MKKLLKTSILLFSISLLISACGNDDEPDPGQNNNNNNQSSLPASIAGSVVNMEFSHANPGAPYDLGDLFKFTFSSSGMLFIDIDPDANNGDEITVNSFTMVGNEYVWNDAAAGYKYALSLKADGSINEVNLSSSADVFLGQFTPIDPNSGPDLTDLKALAGTYTVTTVDKGTHTRMTLSIDANGNIDYDDGKTGQVGDIEDLNNTLLIDGTREQRISYKPYPTIPYVTIILESEEATGELFAVEYRVNKENSSMERFKVFVEKQ